MGLDMFVYVLPKEVESSIDSDVDFRVNVDVSELFYWRKHNSLHGWMESLYRAKGGVADSFNCVHVMLNMNDLCELEKAVNSCTLPQTSGFFFGEDSTIAYEEYYQGKDLTFIDSAKRALQDGHKIYYSSWW